LWGAPAADGGSQRVDPARRRAALAGAQPCRAAERADGARFRPGRVLKDRWQALTVATFGADCPHNCFVNSGVVGSTMGAGGPGVRATCAWGINLINVAGTA